MVFNSILAIKILANECQEVNAHVQLTVLTCKKCRLEKWRVFAKVRGYHEYQDIWTATSGERLKCARKIRNHSDLFAVAVHFSFHSLVPCTTHRWLKSPSRLLVFLKYLRMSIFGQATGDTPRRVV